jgi:TfoX/Sxy family transcriptional regulator of competence genes
MPSRFAAAVNAEGVLKMNEQELAASVRAALSGAGTIREVKMFGGIGFMLNGNLIAGASNRGLLVRVGKARQREALAQPGARPMEMKGRTMEGYIYVDHPALHEHAVQACIRLALPHVLSLPPKVHRTKREGAKGKGK